MFGQKERIVATLSILPLSLPLPVMNQPKKLMTSITSGMERDGLHLGGDLKFIRSICQCDEAVQGVYKQCSSEKESCFAMGKFKMGTGRGGRGRGREGGRALFFLIN